MCGRILGAYLKANKHFIFKTVEMFQNKHFICWEIKEVLEEGKLLIMIAYRIGLLKPSFQGGEGQGRFLACTEDTGIWNITFYYAHIQPSFHPPSCFYMYLGGPPDSKLS